MKQLKTEKKLEITGGISINYTRNQFADTTRNAWMEMNVCLHTSSQKVIKMEDQYVQMDRHALISRVDLVKHIIEVQMTFCASFKHSVTENFVPFNIQSQDWLF